MIASIVIIFICPWHNVENAVIFNDSHLLFDGLVLFNSPSVVLNTFDMGDLRDHLFLDSG